MVFRTCVGECEGLFKREWWEAEAERDTERVGSSSGLWRDVIERSPPLCTPSPLPPSSTSPPRRRHLSTTSLTPPFSPGATLEQCHLTAVLPSAEYPALVGTSSIFENVWSIPAHPSTSAGKVVTGSDPSGSAYHGQRRGGRYRHTGRGR